MDTKGVLLKHTMSGKETPTSLRHVRRAYVHEKAVQDQLGGTVFKPGMLIVVKLKRSGLNRVWAIAQLEWTTGDELAWQVAWYNCHAKKGSNLLDATWYPAWLMQSGKERYCSKKPKDAVTRVHGTVKVHRFVPPAFELQSGKLPPAVRAKLRSIYPAKDLRSQHNCHCEIHS